jgi:hypothetical protein
MIPTDSCPSVCGASEPACRGRSAAPNHRLQWTSPRPYFQQSSGFGARGLATEAKSLGCSPNCRNFMADSDSEKVPGRVANADEKLHGVVNASGFAFQLGIEHQIREAAERHQWKILSREHAWRDGSRAGFADLILEKGILRLVIECKRVREGVWIFLVPEGEDDIGTFRAHWADSSPDKPNMVGWHPMNLQPPSPEAEFCVVRGQGEGDKPMLERIASSLLDSISAIAIEELDLPDSRKFAKHLIHIPVIVTNADLVVCRYSARV